jgi:hypothetical protein
MAGSDSTETVRREVSKLSSFLTDTKVIVVITVALVAAIFYAGTYFYQAKETINQALETLKRDDETITQLKADVSEARSTVDKLRASLPHWSPAVKDGTMSGPGGGTTYQPSTCPDGYYAVGLRTWGSPDTTKFCVGCLDGAQLICRPLKTE